MLRRVGVLGAVLAYDCMFTGGVMCVRDRSGDLRAAAAARCIRVWQLLACAGCVCILVQERSCVSMPCCGSGALRHVCMCLGQVLLACLLSACMEAVDYFLGRDLHSHQAGASGVALV